jgi:ketosteroid isomerase-like protein
MKFTEWLFALTLFSSLGAFAQEATEAELNRLEDARYQAMQDSDTATLNQLFADDFVYQTLQGKTWDKAGYVNLFKTGGVKIYSFKRENSRVKFYQDTATVMAVTHLDVDLGGKRQNVSLFYLNVWHARDGRWQLVARQSTALPKPQQ